MKTRNSLQKHQAEENKPLVIKSDASRSDHTKTHRNTNFVKRAKGQKTRTQKTLPVLLSKSKRIRKPAASRKKPPPSTNDAVVHRKKTFTCDLCQRHVGTKGGLRYHINAHLFGRPFKCDVCAKSFATNNDLTTHKKSHAGRSTCDFCQQTFATKHILAYHIGTAHSQKDFECKWCKRFFATKSILNRHMHFIHPAKEFQKPPKNETFNCDLCKSIFKRKQLYSNHLKLRAKLKFECSYCHQKFPCLKIYQHHRVVEEKNFDHKCPICEKTIVNSVFYHVKKHHGKFQCQICPFFSNSYSELLHHKKICGTEEQIEANGYKCSTCQLSFRSKRKMQLHRIAAHADCLFKCPQCPAHFRRRRNLQVHIDRHRVCKIRCLFCPTLLFSTMEKFNFHFSRHCSNGMKGRYFCNYCVRTFKIKKYLRDHIVYDH